MAGGTERRGGIIVIARITGLLFTVGLALLIGAIWQQFELGEAPMRIGAAINQQALAEVGAANVVTSVVLGYRGIDTLGEIAILFSASLVVGFCLKQGSYRLEQGGAILRHSSALLMPLLLVVGFYIILHGHLTPGGGFQGGVVLAIAFFLPLLAGMDAQASNQSLLWFEGGAGAVFILIGLYGLMNGGSFMQPVGDQGVLGGLVSASTLPMLYLAVGIKVGSELAALLLHLSATDEEVIE